MTHSPSVPPCGAQWEDCGRGECYDASGGSVSELQAETQTVRHRGCSQTFMSPVGGLRVHTAPADEEEEKDKEGCGVSLSLPSF